VLVLRKVVLVQTTNGRFYRHRRHASEGSDAERSRASQDGGSVFAPDPRTAVPSMTHARIPVRPKPCVGYASGN